VRLWTLHPRYLDAQGLVALWREALLARQVLRGRTEGYRQHPQLQRFRLCTSPRSAINQYLAEVHAEASVRGYCFDRSKLARHATIPPIPATDGQLRYEWRWLLSKLRHRSPEIYHRYAADSVPAAHPLFRITPGPVAEWERVPERQANATRLCALALRSTARADTHRRLRRAP
jgi:pyrimidine dimer DNA glycosylase